MSGQLAAAILAAPGSFARGGEEKVAIIAARRLPVAALSALLLPEPGYRLVQEAHGTTEVRSTPLGPRSSSRRATIPSAILITASPCQGRGFIWSSVRKTAPMTSHHRSTPRSVRLARP